MFTVLVVGVCKVIIDTVDVEQPIPEKRVVLCKAERQKRSTYVQKTCKHMVVGKE